MNAELQDQDNKTKFKPFSILKQKLQSMPTKYERWRMVKRNSFEKYLPWICFDEENDLYLTDDDNVGLIWSCYPHNFSSNETANNLQSIFTVEIPENTIVSFHLLADDFIDPILTSYLSQKTRSIPVIHEAAQEYAHYLGRGREGLTKLQGIPTRNFRLIICVKMPCKAFEKKGKLDTKEIKGLKNSLYENLKRGSFIPEPMKPPELLAMVRRFFNPEWGKHLFGYNEKKEIYRQCIKSDTPIRVLDRKRLKIGDRYFDCQTVKEQPRHWEIQKMNKIFGSYMGAAGDSQQINGPFLCTVHLVYRNYRLGFAGKGGFTCMSPNRTVEKVTLIYLRYIVTCY